MEIDGPRWTSQRVAARAVDLTLAFVLGLAPGIGLLSAAAFVLLADAIPGGSPGKRLLHLRCERRRPDRPWDTDAPRAQWLPLRLSDSALRNLPIAAPMLLPPLLGLLGALGLALGLLLLGAALLFEWSLLAHGDGGARLGDILADTRVVGPPPQTHNDRVAWDPDLGDPSA